MIRYLELPKVPDSIINNLPKDFSLFERKTYSPEPTYTWTDSFNQELNQWGQKAIGQDLYFAFQIITANLSMHRDRATLTKIIYLIDPGGDNVETVFYDNDAKEEYSIVIETGRWHLLQADKLHSVRGIVPGRTRFSITARIFP